MVPHYIVTSTADTQAIPFCAKFPDTVFRQRCPGSNTRRYRCSSDGLATTKCYIVVTVIPAAKSASNEHSREFAPPLRLLQQVHDFSNTFLG
jgi:hypothetical protein